MNLVLPDAASFRLGGLDGGMFATDAEFFDWCQQNRNLRIERVGRDEVIVMSPAGGESSNRSLRVARQLLDWADDDGSGIAFDSSAGFELPDGSVLSPDASWVRKTKILALSKESRRRFLPVVPDLVVEVPSPSDSDAHLRRKMELWIGHGVPVGLLVKADERVTEIWRAGGMEVSRESELAFSEFPGLRLELRPVWRGLTELD